MDLSVIIPVFNAENFIEATAKSVLTQDYCNFELILVDDGSHDRSGALCDNIAQRHNNVTALHKPNGGVSSARNAGIDAAKGKYLTFIDADDQITAHMLADMMNEAVSKNADKVFCDLEEIHDNGTHELLIADLPARRSLDRPTIINIMLRTGCAVDSYMNRVCGSFFRTDLIRKHKLQFENRPMGEDWLFNMRYCDLIETAVYVDKPYYQYLRNSSSAVSRFQPRQFELWLENRAYRRQLAEKYQFSLDKSQIDSIWVSKVLFYCIEIIHNEIDYRDRLRKIFCNEEFSVALYNASSVKPSFFRPVVWLLSKKKLKTAEKLLQFYSKRIR